MSLCLQNHTLSPFVIMSFCLKKCICLAPSLCYSVFKTTPSVTPVLLLLCLQNYPVSLCHYVILSKNHPCPPRPSVILSSRPPFLLLLSSCYSVFKITLSPLSSCYSVLKNYPVSPRPPVILSSRTTLSGYLYYYIYPACDRLFCVVPLHRHQE